MDASYFINGLVQRGMSPDIAKGFVANFISESGLNPGINEANPTVEGSRGGFGLYQLTGPRRRQYEAWARDRGADAADPEAQMDFMMLELGTTEKGAWEAIQGASDPVDAARLVSEKFLRPGIPHMDARLANARKLAGIASDGAPSAPKPRDPARLAYMRRSGKMTPEDAALYDQGVASGAIPAPRAQPEKQSRPDPLAAYQAVAMNTPLQLQAPQQWPGLAG